MAENILSFDNFYNTLSSYFPSTKFTECHSGKIISNNITSEKSIVYLLDEPATGFKELDTELQYYFYTDQEITESVIAKIAKNYLSDLKLYFNFNEFISHDAYKNMAGTSWPTYDDFLQDKFEKNSEIHHEISSYISQYYEEPKINEYIDVLTNKKLKFLLDVKNLLSSLDKENTVILTENDIVYDFLINNGFKSVYMDVFHVIISDNLALRELPDIKINEDQFDYNYYCLNKRFATHREKTIRTLNKYNLLDHGHVTQNGVFEDKFSYKTKFNNVLYNALGDSEIFDLNLSDWKNHHTHNNTRYSNHVRNLFHINENLRSKVALVTETSMDNKYISEKSTQPFHLGKIPLILGCKGINNFLKCEGFDMFSDIIDYSFDSIDDVDLRIDTAIKTNRDVLENFTFTNDIVRRLEYNQNYLLHTWTDNKLKKIINQVQELFG